MHLPHLGQTSESLLTDMLLSDLVQSLRNKTDQQELSDGKTPSKKPSVKGTVFGFSGLFRDFFAAEHVMPPTLDSLTVINALQRP